MSTIVTIVFFLLFDPRDERKRYRAVGGPNIGQPWMLDMSFATEILARDQILEWICALTPLQSPEFHDLTR
jgi:hypothetical protein